MQNHNKCIYNSNDILFGLNQDTSRSNVCLVELKHINPVTVVNLKIKYENNTKKRIPNYIDLYTSHSVVSGFFFVCFFFRN